MVHVFLPHVSTVLSDDWELSQVWLSSGSGALHGYGTLSVYNVHKYLLRKTANICFTKNYFLYTNNF